MELPVEPRRTAAKIRQFAGGNPLDTIGRSRRGRCPGPAATISVGRPDQKAIFNHRILLHNTAAIKSKAFKSAYCFLSETV